MKNKVVILVSFVVIIFIIVIAKKFVVNDHDSINNLLYEKYGENFKIVHDSGNEYEGGLLPSFKKTGYKNVIASSENKEEIKFNVRLKLSPLEIERDDYIPTVIAYNTSKKIEANYKLGSKMYVHTSANVSECDGKITNSFFDSIKAKGSIVISIYSEVGENQFNYTEYLNKIAKEFNFDSTTMTGIIRLYLIKENGIQKIEDYYKNNNDTVKVENKDLEIRKKYFKSTNKDYYINF